MAVSGSGNNQDPLQAYRLAARDAQSSGKLDDVVRGQEGSGAIKTGKMSWKEWFISWLPTALVSGGSSKEVSTAFQQALETAKNAKNEKLSSASKEYLASGKPLTARKVIQILVAEGFGKDATLVDQNIANCNALVSHYNTGKKDRDQLKEGSPQWNALRLVVTGNPDAYTDALGADYFNGLEEQGAKNWNALKAWNNEGDGHEGRTKLSGAYSPVWQALQVVVSRNSEAYTGDLDQSYFEGLIEQKNTNFDAFVKFYNDRVPDASKKLVEGNRAYNDYKALFESAPEAYEHAFEDADFVNMTHSKTLSSIESALGSAKDKKTIETYLGHLNGLVDKVKDSGSGAAALKGKINSAIRLAQAKLELLEWDAGERGVLDVNIAFTDTVQEKVLSKFNYDAFKNYEDEALYGIKGKGSDLSLMHLQDGHDPEAGDATILMRAAGLAKDIGRCDAKLNGDDFLVFDADAKMEDGEIAQKMEQLLNVFQEKYGEDKGAEYLKQLSNILGQALLGIALPSIDKEFEVIGKGNPDVSYGITLNDDGTVGVEVSYKKQVKAVTKEGINFNADLDQSYEEMKLNFTFSPEGEPKFVLSDDCRYEQHIVPKA